MRVRDHVALSVAAAALVYPRLRRATVVPLAASILIDVDHFAWFSVRTRRLDPGAAVRFFNSAEPASHAPTRVLHHPAVLLGLYLVSRRRPAAALPLLGMAFHVALDRYHRVRTRLARTAALSRDRLACQACGALRSDAVAHLWRQPRLLPSYRLDHFVTLCPDCHALAHASGARAVAPGGTTWDSYLALTGLDRVSSRRLRQGVGA